MNVDFKQPVPIGRPIRAEGWVTRCAARASSTPQARSSTPGRGDGPRDGATASYIAADEGAQARTRRLGTACAGTGRLERDDARARRERHGAADHRPPTRAEPSRAPTSTARRRVRRRPRAGRRSARARRWRTASSDPDAFATAPDAGLRSASPTPSTSRASSASRPARCRRYGVRWPLHGGRRPRLPRRPRGATAPSRSCSSPTACSARTTSRPAGSPSTSSSGRSPTEPERTWQLLRRARARGGRLDHRRRRSPIRTARASLAEPYRWAELEQLVFSPSRWERRLVGSTIATMTHVDRRRGRDPEVAAAACRSSAS